jgi:hypothetical protein
MIALSVSRCFFPARTNITDVFIDFWKRIQASMTLAFEEKSNVQCAGSIQSLSAECQDIRKKALAIRYELLFHQISQRNLFVLLNKTTLCTQYVIHLIDAWNWLAPHLSPQEKTGMETAFKTTQYNMEALIRHLQTRQMTSMLPVTRVTDLINKTINACPGRFASLDSDALGYYSLMYFFARLNACLHEVNSILNKA